MMIHWNWVDAVFKTPIFHIILYLVNVHNYVYIYTHAHIQQHVRLEWLKNNMIPEATIVLLYTFST